MIPPGTQDILRVLPELAWCGAGVLLMLLQPFVKNRQVLTLISMLGAAAGTLATFYANIGEGFGGLVRFDTFSLFFDWLIGLVAFLVILASDSSLEREKLAPAEFYALILFATAGLGVLPPRRNYSPLLSVWRCPRSPATFWLDIGAIPSSPANPL